MKPFIIYTYSYSSGSGGIKVMHKLCDLLNKNGFESYLQPALTENKDEFKTSLEYNTPLASQELLDNIDQAIVVYPERVRFNPLEAKNAVRWMLGMPTGDVETWGKSDLIYWYMKYFYFEPMGFEENILGVVEFHDDIFVNKNLNRKGSCFTIRKGICTNVHPLDAIEIDYNTVNNLEQTAELFNTTERFYSYDTYTMLSVQAAMCGCISIVIPDETISKEGWLNGSCFNKYGIAYGEDDIPRALETLPLLFEEIKKAKLEMDEKVIKFANHCNEYFK
jgi:hypothetical protein